MLALLPVTRRAKANALIVEVSSIFGHFVAGQLALCAIVARPCGRCWRRCTSASRYWLRSCARLATRCRFFGMIVAQVIAAALAIPQGTGMVIYVSVRDSS